MTQTATSDPSASDPGRCTEPELTHPVLECTPDGGLNRAAIGWSRRPLHRCNLSGHFLRKKRWDYWCVTTDEYLLSLTYTNLDFVGLATVMFLEYAPARKIEKTVAVPFGLRFSQPETVAGADIHFDRSGLQLDILESSDGTRLRARARAKEHQIEADIVVTQPTQHESLTVLIPWSDQQFQVTSKHNTRPATGVVRIDDREYAFGPHNHAFGCLDFGRGVWPRRTAWNWASASGIQRGRTIGLNLGAKWTDGTGMTENGLCIDGRLHKLSEDLVWTYDRANWTAPWRIRTPVSDRVDLTLTPFYPHGGRLNLGLISSDLHVMFGHFAGTVVTDEGERILISNLMGWAEEHLARW